MFNVLPDNFKEKIRQEYQLRRLIVVVCCMMFVSISFLVLLFPTWLLTVYHHVEVGLEVSTQQKFLASRNTHMVVNVIDSTNEKLRVINNSFTYPHIVPLLDTVIGVKSNTISIRTFTILTSGTSTATVSLSGVSSTREALVSFVKKLQHVPTFSGIQSPVSNLAKDSNIEFNITLTSTQ